MKKLLFLAPVALLVTFASPAFAATPVCDLSQPYKAFLSATANPSYTSDSISQEASARINLLTATIACAENDLQSLKDGLPAATDEKAGQVRDRVSGAIDDAINFYDLKRSTLAGQGIQGTKDLAQSIKTWRDTNYNNLLGRIQNFSVWNGNQNIFDAAADRVSQSQFAVISLKIIDGQDAQSVFSAAKNDWNSASDLNNQAGEAISRGAAPDETSDIIMKSLSSLASAYKKFLDIGNRLTGTNSTSTSQ